MNHFGFKKLGIMTTILIGLVGSSLLAEANPNIDQYQQSVQAGIPSGGVMEPLEQQQLQVKKNYFRRTLQQGMRGNDVKKLQKLLNLKVTGYYNRNTARAVRKLQKKFGLTATGRLDKITRHALNKFIASEAILPVLVAPPPSPPPPPSTKNCSSDIYECSEWNTCSNGLQQRKCTLQVDCPLTTMMPAIEQTCTITQQSVSPPQLPLPSSNIPLSSGTANCGGALVERRTNSVETVSNMVTNYPLIGEKGMNHYNILFLLFNASSFSADKPPSDPWAKDYFTPQELGDDFFNDSNGVHAFIQENSYGNLTFSGTVVGWFNLGAQKFPATDFSTNYEKYIDMANSYVEFGQYDIIYLVGLTDGNDVHQVGWLGERFLAAARRGGKYQQGLDFLVNTIFFNEAGAIGFWDLVLPNRAYVHELLHTIGVGHSVSLNCGNQVIATHCTVTSYGGVFSIVGDNAFGTHIDVAQKQKIGWLSPNQLQDITSGGEYGLCPLETVDTGRKGLKIPLKTPITIDSSGVKVQFDRLIIEYRRPLGFDRYLNRLQSSWLNRYKTDGPVRSDGVIIYLGNAADPDNRKTYLLDMHPATSYVQDAGIKVPGNVGKFADAILLIGETFELADQGIRITPLHLTTDGGVMVKIER